MLGLGLELGLGLWDYVFPKADPQCINTQRMRTNHIISVKVRVRLAVAGTLPASIQFRLGPCWVHLRLDHLAEVCRLCKQGRVAQFLIDVAQQGSTLFSINPRVWILDPQWLSSMGPKWHSYHSCFCVDQVILPLGLGVGSGYSRCIDLD